MHDGNKIIRIGNTKKIFTRQADMMYVRSTRIN